MKANQLAIEIKSGRISKVEIINNQNANEDRFEICFKNIADDTKITLSQNGSVKVFKRQYNAIAAIQKLGWVGEIMLLSYNKELNSKSMTTMTI